MKQAISTVFSLNQSPDFQQQIEKHLPVQTAGLDIVTTGMITGDQNRPPRKTIAPTMGKQMVGEPLDQILISTKPKIAQEGCLTECQHNLESRQATGALADVLTHDDTADVRRMAAWALGQIEDPSAAPALEAGLRDGSAGVRETSAWALGQIEPAAAPPALVAALSDPDMSVRKTVAWALGQIGDTNAAGPLAHALENTTDTKARETMVWALGEMEMSGPVRNAMIKLLKDSDPDIRAAAAQALGGGSMGPRPEPRPRG